MPLAISASAVSSTSDSEMNGPNRFHEFQPIGGVGARPSLTVPSPTPEDYRRLRLLRCAGRIERHEVRVARHREQLRRERRRLTEETRHVDDLLDDVARVA